MPLPVLLAHPGSARPPAGAARHSLLAAFLAVSSLAAHGETLESVLARVDASAQSFRSMTADVKRVNHTAVLNDTSVETGTVSMRRVKANDLRVLMELREPDRKSVAFRGTKAEIYFPKIQVVQEYDLGKQRSLVDQYLALGFGASSKEISKSYTVKLGAAREIGGKKASCLELTPRSRQAAEQVQKVDLCLDAAAGYPVEQKIHTPTGYMLISYTNIRWNPDLKDDAVRLQLPKGVKREFPQK